MPLDSEEQDEILHKMISNTIHDWPVPQVERVSYRSEGMCLIFGPTERVSIALSCLPPGLKSISFSPQIPESYNANQNYVGDIVKIEGYMGTYRAQITAGGENRDIGSLSSNKNRLFDLILDLNDSPLLPQEVFPLGYYHVANNNAQDIDRILGQMAQCIGTLYKPRYYNYNESICAHERQNMTGCSQCLDNCPAAAIQSTDDQLIQINSFLCQGCGSCTQVCPSGALSYTYPDRKTILQRLKQLIESFNLLSNEAPNILFYEDNLKQIDHLSGLLNELPNNILPFPLHSIASIGKDLWLALLASGAASLYLLRPSTASSTVHLSLSNEIQCAQDLLLSLGIEAERIQLIRSTELHKLEYKKFFHLPFSNMNIDDWPNDKRGFLLKALEQLLIVTKRDGLTCPQSTDSGLGSLKLDDTRCTLCQACVHLCPTSALSIDTSLLKFQQTACVQCGICVEGCPEQALKLDPVFFFDPASLPSVLFESKNRAECIHCGKSFADKRFVDKSITLVKNLPFFQAKQVDLLRMCSDCRQQEAMKQ